MRIKPVVLSGGSGTRLWPSSRKSLPKQFIEFPGTGSLFARTLERAAAISASAPLVISSRQHGFLCRKAARQQGSSVSKRITFLKKPAAIPRRRFILPLLPVPLRTSC